MREKSDWNRSESGTKIIEELGEEEIETGAMIVYTSADSVLQICGNEETFDLANLYRCCEIAREITMKDEWRVGRVIARPYVGKKKGEFKRTSNRRDYALEPTGKTALDALKDAGKDVIAVGKIHDIFCGEGITESYHSNSSVHGMEQTIEICKKDFDGLCFVNLVDFDAQWDTGAIRLATDMRLRDLIKILEFCWMICGRMIFLLLPPIMETIRPTQEPIIHGNMYRFWRIPKRWMRVA